MADMHIDRTADVFTPEQRSKIMARVRSKDTQPEILVRSTLHAMGYRFRLHRKDLPGNPDIVLPRHWTVIFVHGCFWHQHAGCAAAALPKGNRQYWERKLSRNAARDGRNQQSLDEQGWRVIVLWECDLRKMGLDLPSWLHARLLRLPSR